MARLLEYVWRRHLQAATRRAMLHRARGADEGISPVMAVGFADMVGFTMLSQHLGDEELAAVVARFEALAHDTVVALGGRVVKMIGDEVMFVVPTATGAASIGLSLAEAYAGDDLLSDVRVALAIGPVLIQDGDFYGPVVNLASRLVGVANPGTVLVSDEFRAALEAEARPTGDPIRRLRAAGPADPQPEGHRPGPGVEAVPCRHRARAPTAGGTCGGSGWKGCCASSTNCVTGASRWSHRVSAPSAPRPRSSGGGDSVAVEPGGGDALGPELEAPLERSDGTPP